MTGIKGYKVQKKDAAGNYKTYKTLKASATKVILPKVKAKKAPVTYRIYPYTKKKQLTAKGAEFTVEPTLGIVKNVRAKADTAGISLSWSSVNVCALLQTALLPVLFPIGAHNVKILCSGDRLPETDFHLAPAELPHQINAPASLPVPADFLLQPPAEYRALPEQAQLQEPARRFFLNFSTKPPPDYYSLSMVV